MTMEGQLSKLRINGFPDLLFKTKIGAAYEAYFNPESYSVSYESEYCGGEAKGSPDAEMRFIRLPPRTFSFDLLIDGTGASGPKVSVPKEVARFLAATYQFQPENRRPPYLILSWGTMVAKCVLTNVNVSYNLFSPNGVPLRAKLSTTFKTVTARPLIDALLKKDKAKNVLVKVTDDADSVPSICDMVYGTASAVISLAAANGLRNIKKVPPGLQMIFPPLTPNK